jgi:hypothetical protein
MAIEAAALGWLGRAARDGLRLRARPAEPATLADSRAALVA